MMVSFEMVAGCFSGKLLVLFRTKAKISLSLTRQSLEYGSGLEVPEGSKHSKFMLS